MHTIITSVACNENMSRSIWVSPDTGKSVVKVSYTLMVKFNEKVSEEDNI